MDTETEIPDVCNSPEPSSCEVDVPNLMREEITDISLSSSGPSSSETVDVPNLLSRLKCPASSDLSRKRKLKSNPPKGLRSGKGSVAVEPSIPPSTRVKEFPNEHLSVVSRKLFCQACREPVSVKKSVLQQHIRSAKHGSSKKLLVSRKAQDKTIADMLRKYDKNKHPIGEGLSDEVRVFRIKVVKSFLKAGVPLAKVDCFREVFEESAFRLSHSSNLSQLIPFIREQEFASITEDIKGNNIGVIFDGTTHVCEAMVIVLRFIDADWQIQQRVVRLMLLAKSLTGEEVARQLIMCLSNELSVSSNQLVAAMRDRASVNNVAIQTLKIVYPCLLDVGCFSHTLDHVGEKINANVLDEFIKVLVGLFTRSPKAKLAWREATGLPVPAYSSTRWWSKWEVMKHMLVTFADVLPFVENNDLPPSSKKIVDILNDPPKSRKLQMELAITVDFGEPFVKATYRLEGDGSLAFSAYEEIVKLQATISAQNFPNATAVANKLSSNRPTQKQQLINYATECIEPAIVYFKQKFEGDLKPIVTAFKYARYFDPAKVSELCPSSADIDQLKAFPFLNNKLEDLKVELPIYMAKADGVSPTIDKLEWWKKHSNELPHWSAACKLVLLVQPSSAAAERVFSLLSNSFGEQQTSSLEETIEASIMLQYNYRK